MAVNGPYAVDSGQVFPYGLALVSEITKALEYDENRPREERRQDRDKDTGLPLWECTLLDLDPETWPKDKTFTVRIASDVQPVAPGAVAGAPLALVRLEGLQIAVRTKVTGKNWKTKQDQVSMVFYLTATGISAVKAGAADGSKAA
jgi:hypothetical protein